VVPLVFGAESTPHTEVRARRTRVDASFPKC